jgi:hypothetical protein
MDQEQEIATLEHSIISGNIFGELRHFLKDKQLGRAFESTAEYRYSQRVDIYRLATGL